MTDFDMSVGDPFPVILASVGDEFSDSLNGTDIFDVRHPINGAGAVYFTPVCLCAGGTIRRCNGDLDPEGEACVPHRTPGGARDGIYTISITN